MLRDPADRVHSFFTHFCAEGQCRVTAPDTGGNTASSTSGASGVSGEYTEVVNFEKWAADGLDLVEADPTICARDGEGGGLAHCTDYAGELTAPNVSIGPRSTNDPDPSIHSLTRFYPLFRIL
jgi:hypothetical protein